MKETGGTMDLDVLQDLVAGLFTDPKATMYKGRNPENQVPTLFLAAAGILLGALFSFMSTFSPISLIVSLIAGALIFVIWVTSIFIGGKVTGGKGSFMEIAQLCGLIQLPLGAFSGLMTLFHLGIVSFIVSLVVGYYLMLIGHSFSGFKDVIFAYIISIILYIGGIMFVSSLTMALLKMFI